MEYQSFGRPQRAKVANIKQVLKVSLGLAVCAWLVYQINHSRNKTENHGGQTKLVDGYGAISLGRKGTPSWLDERTFPDSGNVDSAGESKKWSSGRDDVAKEDKAEEEFGHINENLRKNEGKAVELEQESQLRLSSKNRDKDCSKEKSGKVSTGSRRSESGHKEHGNDKYTKRLEISGCQSNDKDTERQVRDLPNNVHIRKNAKSDFSMKENDEDEDPRIREKESIEGSVRNSGLTEGIDEVLSFHDENGVPPDGNGTEIVVGQAHILHEDNISDFREGSRLGKSNTSGQDNDVELTLDGSKNDATAGEETNTGTVIHVDTTGINRNSEIGEGDSLVV